MRSGFIHARADLTKARDIVGCILFGAQWMIHRERRDQVDVGSTELFKRE